MGKHRAGQSLYHKSYVDRTHLDHTTPCTIAHMSNDEDTVLLTGHGIVAEHQVIHRTLRQCIYYECTRELWVCDNITFIGDIHNITEALRNGTLRGVSDGSVGDRCGTAGWCIIGGNSIIRGVTVIPQSHDKMDSTRSELGGLYCMIRITSIISNYYDITTGSIRVGSDSDAALDNTVLSNFMDKTNLVNGKHLDMVNSLRVLIQTPAERYRR